MRAEFFTQTLVDSGLGPFMGVPCSVFTPWLNYLCAHPEIANYHPTSEGEAMGLAGGFALSGKNPVVYMQNDGYGNAVNPISSLQLLYKLPALLLISWRGQPGQKDAPQHKVMGETILKLLDVFQIPHQILDDGENVLLEKINQAKSYLKERKTPYALIIKKGYFDKYHSEGQEADPILAKRADYVELMDQLVSRDDIILGATGYTGREVSQLMEDKVKFYMMGSMGYLSSLGLGLALEHPEKTVYVLDGDGALLMNLGGMSTIGHYQPANIVHVCFNNYEYESTGNQAANSKTVDFLKIAKACQYRDVFNIEKVEELREIIGNIQQYQKPLFIQIRIRSGTFKDLPRPAESAELMVKRFMESLT